MRSDKELLELLLSEIPLDICHGLCIILPSLNISVEEHIRLKTLIESARPKWYQLRYYCKDGVFRRKMLPYYWTPGDSAVRIKWLEKQIAKLS